ncbi:type IV secretion system protein, partial [Bartonella tribocorum]
PPPPPPKEYLEVIELLKKQIQLKEKQLLEERAIYESVRRSQFAKAGKLDYSSFFLKNPELIYDEKEHKNGLYQQVVKNEKSVFGNFTEMRKQLLARLQYMASLDKAITLQTFEESKNRFSYFSIIPQMLEKAQNLKDIIDLQTYLEGALAMVENESIKLQMVTHLRHAEYALIKMRRRELDMSVFTTLNKSIPFIRLSSSSL